MSAINAAEILISGARLSDNPVWQKLIHLGDKRGVKIFAGNFRNTPLEGWIRGYYFDKDVVQAIIIDSSLSEEERQFSLAHELGHYVRHRASGYSLDSPKELIAQNEKEADYFASRLLQWIKRHEPCRYRTKLKTFAYPPTRYGPLECPASSQGHK